MLNVYDTSITPALHKLKHYKENVTQTLQTPSFLLDKYSTDWISERFYENKHYGLVVVSEYISVILLKQGNTYLWIIYSYIRIAPVTQLCL